MKPKNMVFLILDFIGLSISTLIFDMLFLKKKALNRSSHPEVFCKKGALRNFTKTPVPGPLF